MKHNSLIMLTLIFVLACGFIAGRHGRFQAGYDQAMDDVASGEISVTSTATQTHDAQVRELEYERVVSAVAERYDKDPSEVEVECGLTDEKGVRR